MQTGEAEAINTEAEMRVERAALRQENPDLRSEASLAIMDVDDPQVKKRRRKKERMENRPPPGWPYVYTTHLSFFVKETSN